MSMFHQEYLPDAVFTEMLGVSFFENPYILAEDLRYLTVCHWGFDGLVHRGELVVHQMISEEILEIFECLYANNYPIEKIQRMEVYGGDDNLAMADNNTSCFNYRNIAGTDKLSRHSLGMAIDVNPRYNPYIRQDGNERVIVEPPGSEIYVDREKEFPYKLYRGELCCQLFLERGYTWGGDWTSLKDYQHFQK